MTYEYEEEVKSVIGTETVFSYEETEKEARVKELQEVCRKAKAWDNYISDVRERVKITVNTDDDIEKETQEVIDYYLEDE